MRTFLRAIAQLIRLSINEERAVRQWTAETLRCIYCQRTMKWPVDQVWPPSCPYCGGLRGMAAAQ